jgi:hypothetical protein
MYLDDLDAGHIAEDNLLMEFIDAINNDEIDQFDLKEMAKLIVENLKGETDSG